MRVIYQAPSFTALPPVDNGDGLSVTGAEALGFTLAFAGLAQTFCTLRHAGRMSQGCGRWRVFFGSSELCPYFRGMVPGFEIIKVDSIYIHFTPLLLWLLFLILNIVPVK
jgi:hypothetical protein